MKAKKVTAKAERVLILRTCDSEMRSFGGFVWPRIGRVEAPDWRATTKCGNGLHGFLNGEGDGSLASFDTGAVWIAAWVEKALIIDLGGKVKFPWAEVAIAGTREEAIQFLRDNGCSGAIVGGTATAGHRGTATAGYGGTATAGDEGTATAGDEGTATAGYGGTATAGHRGTATAGYGGTATAGDEGTATAGDRGTATAGHRGTATAGDGGILNIRYWDGNRYRIATFYVGEDDIQPNTKYSVTETGKPVLETK